MRISSMEAGGVSLNRQARHRSTSVLVLPVPAPATTRTLPRAPIASCCDSVRLMESLHLFPHLHWDHEPKGARNFSLSSSGGEGRGEEDSSGAGSWRASFRFFACIGTMNQQKPLSPTLSHA